MNMARVADTVDFDEKLLLHFAKQHYKNDPRITWNGRQIFNGKFYSFENIEY